MTTEISTSMQSVWNTIIPNITLATMEQKVAKQLNFYKAVTTTTNGESDYKSFVASALCEYDDHTLADKWCRITKSTTVSVHKIKDNYQDTGKVFLYVAFASQITTGCTVQIFNYDPTLIGECINDAIEMSYPELSRPYDDKSTTTPSSAPYYCWIPTGIKLVQKVEVGLDSTDQGNWIPVDFEIVYVNSVALIKLVNYQYQGSLLRIAGVGVLGSYTLTSQASSLAIPEEWIRPLVFAACYNLFTRISSSISSNDNKELLAMADKYYKEYSLQKVIHAISHYNPQGNKQFEVISEG